MSRQQKPILHGRDHAPGGADPIPGWCCGLGYRSAVEAITGLRGYWRLGNPGAPYADTSDFDPDPDDLTGGSLFHVPGALRGSNDDGAVENPLEQGPDAAPGDGPVLSGSHNGRFNFDGAAAAGETLPSPEEFSVAAFVYPFASTDDDEYKGQIVGATNAISGGPSWAGGWALRLNYPSLTVEFTRGQSGSGGADTTVAAPVGLSFESWHHVVGTYDGSIMSLYVDGALAGTAASPHTLPALNEVIKVGSGSVGVPPDEYWGFFCGRIDEVAVWDGALTPEQVAGLHTAADLPPVYYTPPAPLPVIPATPTVQDIADVLVELGLATQA